MTNTVHQCPKLLIVDSYPLHTDAVHLLSQYNTRVLFIPPGLTYSLQPLDCGFFKVLKDELSKLWVKDRDFDPRNKGDKRSNISTKIRDCWYSLSERNLSVYWEESGLRYPLEDVEYVQRHSYLILT